MLLRTYTILSDSTSISEHKKCRHSADVCQAPAIYGLFHYAHRSQYCINFKHLCSDWHVQIIVKPMNDYQTIERWSFIQSFRCCAFMTVERIFLKPQLSFLGENKKRPSKGNPLEAHISSCFYCLRCGKFFYQYGKAYFIHTTISKRFQDRHESLNNTGMG